MQMKPSRRGFLQGAVAASIGAAVLRTGEPFARAQPATAPKLKKAVKFDMIQIKGSNKDKLELAKKLGFQGVEINSPSATQDCIRNA